MVEIKLPWPLGPKEEKFPIIKHSETPTAPEVEGVESIPGADLEVELVKHGGEAIITPSGTERLPVELPTLTEAKQLKARGAEESAGWLGALTERLHLKGRR